MYYGFTNFVAHGTAELRSRRSLKVLETLAEAVGHDPFNILPLMLSDIRSFEK